MVTTPAKRYWLVTCFCGWEREASSAWAATAIAKLHARHLGVPGTKHAITIAAPPADPPGGEQWP